MLSLQQEPLSEIKDNRFPFLYKFFFFPFPLSQTFGPKCAELQKIDLLLKVFVITELPSPISVSPTPTLSCFQGNLLQVNNERVQKNNLIFLVPPTTCFFLQGPPSLPCACWEPSVQGIGTEITGLLPYFPSASTHILRNLDPAWKKRGEDLVGAPLPWCWQGEGAACRCVHVVFMGAGRPGPAARVHRVHLFHLDLSFFPLQQPYYHI